MPEILRASPPCVLTIAGSDSGGGAGIEADQATIAAFGLGTRVALTAVTAQNSRGVTSIQALRPAMVAAQIDAVLDDFPVRAIKTGMLASPAIVRSVAGCLATRPRLPFVLDPVLVATSGATLATGDLAPAILHHLLPGATLITPNLPEAARLLGMARIGRRGMLAAATALRGRGARAVLLKGGHLDGDVIADLLLDATGATWFEHHRVAGNVHGTGCTLSAAIAAGLAQGVALPRAVAGAIAWLQQAIRHRYRAGRGNLAWLHPGTMTPQ